MSVDIQRIDATTKVLNFRQPPEMSDLKFIQELEAHYNLAKKRGVVIFKSDEESRGFCTLALRNADPSRRGELLQHLHRKGATLATDGDKRLRPRPCDRVSTVPVLQRTCCTVESSFAESVSSS